MAARIDRRTFLRVAGASLGSGAIYRVAAALGGAGEGGAVAGELARRNGEAPTPFTFVQLSDTHVGSSGPVNPAGTAAFERAVERVNALPEPPDLVLFTGDLTHDAEGREARTARMRRFAEIAGRLRTKARRCVPGEHDAAIDGGALYREHFGETRYAFDHRGVHFVALDNASRPRPELGPEQLAWLRRDLARFAPTTPIVVMTHRPLIDLRPDWEWFTRDGDEVMRALAPFENVTVLYGHIHREDVRSEHGVRHCAARSLAWAFPDPATTAEKRPLPRDPQRPFKDLGLRLLHATPGAPAGGPTLRLDEVELTLQERSGTEGFQQWLRPSSLA